MDRIRRSIEILANLAFLVACVTVTAYFVSQWVGRGDTAAAVAAAAENTPFVRGAEMKAMPDAPFSEGSMSAILFIQSQCRFCTESMPFYRQLSSLRSSHRALRLVAASFEDESTLKPYIEQHQLSVDRSVTVTMRDYGISGTPTFVLVDRDGRVLASWRGLMNDNQEAAALALIRAGATE